MRFLFQLKREKDQIRYVNSHYLTALPSHVNVSRTSFYLIAFALMGGMQLCVDSSNILSPIDFLMLMYDFCVST